MTSDGSPLSRDIVLVHSSDLHVDARVMPGGKIDGVCNLAAVLNAARQIEADLILLAGDTFDSHRQPDSLVEQVNALFAAAAAPVVILPGNHDPLVGDAIYHRL